MPESWKEKAFQTLKDYYLMFNGMQWHTFEIPDDEELLKVKICFALYGLESATAEASTIEEAYSDEQKDGAGTQRIIKGIYKLAKIDQAKHPKLHIGFAFVICVAENSEACIPVISVLIKKPNGQETRSFVDTHGRIYEDWKDWEKNNMLPKVEIAYPKDGFFTCCEKGTSKFDKEKDPIIEFGKSPQCSAFAVAKSVGDIASTVTSLGCAAVGIVSLFTPFAPLTIGSAVVGGLSATYGAARGVETLVDKGKHGQSLNDMESLALWFSIAATPLHFASSAVTGILAKGAVQQGRIFSQGMRVCSNVVLCTTFGVDAALFGISLASLINKAKENEVSKLDVLQFSISLFFFSNTLVQPKTASGIIRQAQSTHFENTAASLQDKNAKATFDKFLQNNKVDGSIQERSKIVRFINKADDGFFASVNPEASLKIGNRKATTAVIKDQHGFTQRVKTSDSKVVHTNTQQPNAANNQVASAKSEKLQADFEETIKHCYGEDASKVELNGVKIFDNLTDSQRKHLGKVLSGTADCNKSILTTAHSVSEKMGCTTFEEFKSIVEIVKDRVKGIKSSSDKIADLNKMDTNAFIEGIKTDIAKVEAIGAENGGLKFRDSYKAVYHYRKHGEDFHQKYGSNHEAYFCRARNQVINSTNLREVITLPNGDIKYKFATRTDDFAVIVSSPDGTWISSIYNKSKCFAEYAKLQIKFSSNMSSSSSVILKENIAHIAKLVVANLGLSSAFNVVVTVNGMQKSLSDCEDDLHGVDEATIEYIGRA